MKDTTRLLLVLLCACSLIAFGCVESSDDDDADSTPDVTKDEAAQMQGKGDSGVDLCEFLGWYGDGICDDFCVLPDPDCGAAGCVSDSDCAAGQNCQAGTCVASSNQCGGIAGLTCPAGQFCDYALEDSCGIADHTGVCEPIPQACAEIYMPVCGCDGQTYSNECHAKGAGVSVAAEGPCAAQCTADADCAAGQVCQNGACVDDSPATCGGISGQTCAADEFCRYAPEDNCGIADHLGTCEPRPEACAQIYDPVCGCDGQTYSNACTANAAGVSVGSQGACDAACTANADCAAGQICQNGACVEDPGSCQANADCAAGQECVNGTCQEASAFCGGFAGFTCDADEWCDYDDSTGIACGAADGGGTCQPRPEACTQIYDPVCGCDGQTYSNECMAKLAGTDIWASGSCN